MSSVEQNRMRVKRHYEKHRVCGIYKIINKTDNKYYIGSSNIINRRWRQHKTQLRNNCHRNNHLQRAWNKYGEENFIFEIVETIVKEKLIEVEQKYLDIANTEQDKCYNQSFDAHGGNVGKEAYEARSKKYCGENHHLFGKRLSEEIRQKMSQSKKGMYDGDKHPLYGKHPSQETLIKRSQSMKGKLAGTLNPNYNSTVYSFIHTKTNEIFNGTRYEFCQKIGVKDLWTIMSGKTKTIKGWKVQPPKES